MISEDDRLTDLGWSVAESIVMRLAPLWIGARTLEFDWSYVQSGLEANFGLVNFQFYL